jgi:hypothetical protein
MIPPNSLASDRKSSSQWLWPLLFLIVCLGSIRDVQAGCAGLAHEPTRLVDSRATVAGQLPLSLYVRYEQGRLSFTFERPMKPCEGPSCRTKTTMDPTILPLGGSNLVLSQGDISADRWACQDPMRAKLPRTVSLYAPRGGLDVHEPPPKASL